MPYWPVHKARKPWVRSVQEIEQAGDTVWRESEVVRLLPSVCSVLFVVHFVLHLYRNTRTCLRGNAEQQSRKSRPRR